jgi:hypothetical protein
MSIIIKGKFCRNIFYEFAFISYMKRFVAILAVSFVLAIRTVDAGQFTNRNPVPVVYNLLDTPSYFRKKNAKLYLMVNFSLP